MCQMGPQWHRLHPRKIQWRLVLALHASWLARHWQRRRPRENSTMPWSTSTCQLIGAICWLVQQWQSQCPREIQWHPGPFLRASWLVQRVDWFNSGKFGVQVQSLPGLILIASQLVRCWFDVSTGLRWGPQKIQWQHDLILLASWLVPYVNWIDSGKVGVHVKTQQRLGLILLASWLVQHVDWVDRVKVGIHLNSAMPSSNSSCQSIGLTCLLVRRWQSWCPRKNSMTPWSNSTCQLICVICGLIQRWHSWCSCKNSATPWSYSTCHVSIGLMVAKLAST